MEQSETSLREKRWRCSVCGYIHIGPEPPDKCPVCGADRSKFELLEDAEGAASESAQPLQPSPKKPETGSAARWRCSVCGYIHIGSEPPEKCPVCGSARSKFVRLEPEPSIPESPPKLQTPAEIESRARRIYRLITEHMVDLHAHPISVHIPNGVAPVAVLFLLMAWLFSSSRLEFVSFTNMVVVLLAMPFVLFSGYNDWKRRFGGQLTQVFLGKMICGATFSLISLIIVIWRTLVPEVMASSGHGRAFYIFLHLTLLGVGALAGYLGGKLVFHDQR